MSPAPSSHWSGRCPAFRRDRKAGLFADFAGALDELAGTAGADDGLVLLGRELGITAEQAEHATRAEAAAWFSACYSRYGPPRLAIGAVITTPVGIYDADAGYTPSFPLSYR